MKFSHTTLILSAAILASVMAAPVADSSPSSVPAVTTTKDPMSGATAIASISIGDHNKKNEQDAIKAQKLVASGFEKTNAINVATVALPVTAVFFAFM